MFVPFLGCCATQTAVVVGNVSAATVQVQRRLNPITVAGPATGRETASIDVYVPAGCGIRTLRRAAVDHFPGLFVALQTAVNVVDIVGAPSDLVE